MAGADHAGADTLQDVHVTVRIHCPHPACRYVAIARYIETADAAIEDHIVACHWPLRRA